MVGRFNTIVILLRLGLGGQLEGLGVQVYRERALPAYHSASTYDHHDQRKSFVQIHFRRINTLESR